MDAARLVEGLQRALKLATVHLVESGFLLGGADALHVLQDRRAVRLPQRLEHAAALDARKLRVVARKNEFCASGARGRGDLRKVFGRHHGRLVHNQDGVFIPSAAPAFQRL